MTPMSPKVDEEYIANQLSLMLAEIKKLRLLLIKERTKRRISIGIVSVLLLFGAIGLAVVYQLANEIDQNRKNSVAQSCERGNQARADIRLSHQILVDELTMGRENDPEIKKRLDRLNGNLDQALRAVECPK